MMMPNRLARPHPCDVELLVGNDLISGSSPAIYRRHARRSATLGSHLGRTSYCQASIYLADLASRGLRDGGRNLDWSARSGNLDSPAILPIERSMPTEW